MPPGTVLLVGGVRSFGSGSYMIHRCPHFVVMRDLVLAAVLRSLRESGPASQALVSRKVGVRVLLCSVSQ